MKTFTAIVKILTALAAVAGAVYLIATYGDKIVAWAKKMMASCPCCCDCCDVEVEPAEETAPEAPAEEPAPEEAPVEEVPAEEPAVEEIVIEENEPVAAEEDFEN